MNGTLPPADEEGIARPAPAFSDFATTYEAGGPQLLWRRLPADLDTPVSAYLKLSAGREDTFLLESVEGGESKGRYSTVGLMPDLVWRAAGNRAEINRTPQDDPEAFETDDLPTIASLHGVLEESRIDTPKEMAARLPPMAAGMFGYFGYDFVRLTERLPNGKPAPFDVPDGYFIRPTILAIFDNVRGEVYVVTPVRPRDGVSAADAYERASRKLETALDALHNPLPDRAATGGGEPFDTPFTAHTEDADYLEKVARAKEYIAAGDIFQVVLAQRFSAPFPGDPFGIYRALRRINPSPFLFHLNFRPVTLLGASPEILVRVRDGRITIRPIAGTRRRGTTQAEDLALEKELLNDPKERAEHLMLLDLGRNDVGRTAKIGTVTPTATFTVERYSHVMHIVSNVEGELRDDLRPVDALAAGFPAGTLTGAPKVRAMEIIDELEPEGRGPYGGCIGYFGADGGIDTCIGLRMAVVKDGHVHVNAGAGIVADSDPAAEANECRIKAAAVMRAVTLASRHAGQ